MNLKPIVDRVILDSDPPGMVRGVALPPGYNWTQASGTILASNSADLPAGARVAIVPGAGERVKVRRDLWIRVVEEVDVIGFHLEVCAGCSSPRVVGLACETGGCPGVIPNEEGPPPPEGGGEPVTEPRENSERSV